MMETSDLPTPTPNSVLPSLTGGWMLWPGLGEGEG